MTDQHTPPDDAADDAADEVVLDFADFFDQLDHGPIK